MVSSQLVPKTTRTQRGLKRLELGVYTRAKLIVRRWQYLYCTVVNDNRQRRIAATSFMLYLVIGDFSKFLPNI